MRKAIVSTLLAGALGLAACGTQPSQSGAAQPATTGTFRSLLHRAGATLCSVGHIDPTVQGGSETVNIYSFSEDRSCDAKATANQGLIYFVDNVDVPSAKYFLGLAAVSHNFQAGWRAGDLAIVVGPHLPILRLLGLAKLFADRAKPTFGASLE
jgi:hypothetical protein